MLLAAIEEVHGSAPPERAGTTVVGSIHGEVGEEHEADFRRQEVKAAR
jgi:hypothetical protein